MLNKLAGIQGKLNNIGDEVYQTWSYEQRHEEIAKLVQGYQNGLPVQILCQLSASIAGGVAEAAEHLAILISRRERKAMVNRESGSDKALQDLLQATLLPARN
ncbi:hypothetical protein M1B72_21245 [Geomonas paludis]|uniref:Uncharacterized protein n=1 Tax=Geomonas paludis TaxID=2740185 RepID=A0A6V8MQY2_9BACT|nr:hypothetical protein [Geomonas paludis]UPU35937.1 hypothetical protein M1B72_21245 [Geomonas paludis]GFO62480.1 hypothetical protein GMPD_03990 [Geomonas paludis]